GARGVLTAFADGAPVLMEMAPTPQGQGFKLSSSAAGDALRGLNLFEDGHEGRMTLTGVVQDEGVIVGELFVEDLVVKNAPVVARILSIGTLIGLVDQLGSGGIVFSRIRAGFDVEDGVLVLRDAAASGPSLGFTLQGAVKLSDQTADLSGSVSPAYAVTGAISDVPVLRELLTGGAGEGLIGVSFGVSGPLADPSVSVNPLSAFAIGPLRRLFKRKSKFESARDAEERAERRRERGPLPLEPSLGNR
ncbi:MAG: AsmA-like C-terminal domain-containing protein, partial [Pseudomonadota bacterium]